MNLKILPILAGLLGFSGVGLGAFGAHALELDARGRQLWQTASLYHLVHAAVLVGLVAWQRAEPQTSLTKLGLIFALGTLVFSGSLYLLALGAPRVLGAITPLGGVLWLVGWLGFVGLAFLGTKI